MLSKFKITTDARALLLQSTALLEIVGSKIFPLRADMDTEGSFITYSREQYSVTRDKMGIEEQKCRIAIVCVSSDYDESQGMIEAVFEALDGVHNGVRYELVDSTEDFANEKYIQVALFEIN